MLAIHKAICSNINCLCNKIGYVDNESFIYSSVQTIQPKHVKKSLYLMPIWSKFDKICHLFDTINQDYKIFGRYICEKPTFVLANNITDVIFMYKWKKLLSSIHTLWVMTGDIIFTTYYHVKQRHITTTCTQLSSWVVFIIVMSCVYSLLLWVVFIADFWLSGICRLLSGTSQSSASRPSPSLQWTGHVDTSVPVLEEFV